MKIVPLFSKNKLPLSLSCHTILWNSANYETLIGLRNQCLCMPLGMYLTSEDIHQEKEDILIGGFLYNHIVECCTLETVDNHTFQLCQMVVTKMYNKKD
ncbi:MAG: hypothetical protein ACRCR9_00820 [Chitinophagaceae bacterium]